MNKTYTDEIFTFKNLIDNGLDVVILVNTSEGQKEFGLTYNNDTYKKYLILVRDYGKSCWDIIGEETNYKEAELCFITEVNRYKDLSYEEVDNSV